MQFEAAIAFISSDPLNIAGALNKSPLLRLSHSPSPSIQIHQHTDSGDSETYSGRLGSYALQQGASDLVARSLSSHEGSHAESLPATRIVMYQRGDKRSSIMSTVTTEEDGEELANSGPRPPSTGGNAQSQRSDLPSLLSSRHRATSSYSLASTELQIHHQLVRPVPVRPARSFHVSHNRSGQTMQATRVPLGRSQTTSYTGGPARQPGLSDASASLARTSSESTRRNSVDWWAPLRYGKATTPISPDPAASPVDGALSPTGTCSPPVPASPAVRSILQAGSGRSSYDLERSSSDIGWLEWGRKRLSSMASTSKSYLRNNLLPAEA